MADIEQLMLHALNESGELADSGEFATRIGADHNAVVGTIKSLLAAEMIVTTDIDHFRYALTEEAEGYLQAGSPEAQVFHAVPPSGLTLAELKAKLPGELGDVGFKQAMQQKWMALDKSQGEPRVVRKVRTQR